MAQLESIRYEVRSISLVNPGPLTRKLMDKPQDLAPTGNGTILSSHALLPSNVFASQMIASLCVFLLGANRSLEKPKEELKSTSTVLKVLIL